MYTGPLIAKVTWADEPIGQEQSSLTGADATVPRGDHSNQDLTE